MSVQNGPNRQEPSYVPALGTLMVDTGHGNQVGEFRGLMRPVLVAAARQWRRRMGSRSRAGADPDPRRAAYR